MPTISDRMQGSCTEGFRKSPEEKLDGVSCVLARGTVSRRSCLSGLLHASWQILQPLRDCHSPPLAPSTRVCHLEKRGQPRSFEFDTISTSESAAIEWKLSAVVYRDDGASDAHAASRSGSNQRWSHMGATMALPTEVSAVALIKRSDVSSPTLPNQCRNF